MAIKQKPNGKWEVDVKAAGRKRFRKTYATEKEAKKNEDLYLSGRTPDVRNQSQVTMLDLYNHVCGKIGHSWNDNPDSTPRENGKRVIAFFGESKAASEIDRSEIERFKRHLVDDLGNSKSTVNRKLSALAVMFKEAYEDELIAQIPKIKQLTLRKQERQVRIRTLSRTDEPRFLEIAEQLCSIEWRRYFTVLIETGCRTGEIADMRIENLDIFSKTIEVYPSEYRKVKSGARVVPLTDLALSCLKDQLKDNPSGCIQVFPGVNQRRLNKVMWHRMRDALNDYSADFVPHMLRHTCATRLLEEGCDIDTVKNWMGHEDVATTMRYVHMGASQFENVVEKRNKMRHATRHGTSQRGTGDTDAI